VENLLRKLSATSFCAPVHFALCRASLLRYPAAPFSRHTRSLDLMAHQHQGRRRNKSYSNANHGKRPTRKAKKTLGQTSRDRRAKGR
jgi:hypothetical protein